MSDKIFDLWGDLHEAIRALLMDGVRETGIQDEIDGIFIKWHKEGSRPPQEEEGTPIPELVELFKAPNIFNDPSGSVDLMSSINARLLNLETRIMSLELRLIPQPIPPAVSPSQPFKPHLPPPNTTAPTPLPTTYTPWKTGDFISGCGCGGKCGGNT